MNQRDDISILQGDCLDVLGAIPNNSIQLIVTSPPYADAREDTYGGINPGKYVEWFLPRAEEFFRVLKSKGTFILNIKEKVVDGVRHTYVLELILELIKKGWRWTEEFIWHKTTCFPGRWEKRFKDGWERLLQFNLSDDFYMDKESVKIPMNASTKKRVANLKEKDRQRRNSLTGSKMGWNLHNFVGKNMVYPSNVLRLSPVTRNVGHPAPFPSTIPAWFINIFSNVGDVVLDPFAGSGTTLFTAQKMGRKAIGIDMNSNYVRMVQERINVTNLPLL